MLVRPFHHSASVSRASAFCGLWFGRDGTRLRRTTSVSSLAQSLIEPRVVRPDLPFSKRKKEAILSGCAAARHRGAHSYGESPSLCLGDLRDEGLCVRGVH